MKREEHRLLVGRRGRKGGRSLVSDGEKMKRPQSSRRKLVKGHVLSFQNKGRRDRFVGGTKGG